METCSISTHNSFISRGNRTEWKEVKMKKIVLCTNVFFYILVVFFVLRRGSEVFLALLLGTFVLDHKNTLERMNYTQSYKWPWMNQLDPGLSYQLQISTTRETTKHLVSLWMKQLSPACCSRTTREQQSLQICLCCVVFAIGYAGDF